MIDLNEKTVIELRKIAKEMKVTLSAGISKAGIVEKLTAAMQAQESADDVPAAAEAPAVPDTSEPATVAGSEDEPENAEPPVAQPAYRPAYMAPPRFNSRPAYQASAYKGQGAPRPAAQTDAPRTQTTRPVGFAPRFGPAASPTAPAEPPVTPVQEERPAPVAERRTAFNDANRFQGRPAFEQKPTFEPKPAFEAKPAFEPKPAFEAKPAFEQRPAYDRPRRDAEAAPTYSNNPTMNELIAPVETAECAGVLELLGEGYGFLRSQPFGGGESLLSGPKDVYVAAAQVRRWNLRTGDRITGKCRPQRDGDKYPALLTVGTVNGLQPDSLGHRPSFEAMTPIYPTRRINLDIADKNYADVRLVDLVAPIGFGQRALIQCGARTGKARLLQHLANAISQNNPAAQVMVLLLNITPEDATLFRSQVSCPVYATTFDMPPESHIKMVDMLLESAQRQAEMGRDVVLLADSLTALTKMAPTALMQQGRVAPGSINPIGIQKAKRLFGAARCLREGGSLSVIATMNTESGAKADDSVVNEFRGAANMELVLDTTLARAGLYPPVLLSASGTRRADAILTPEHQEGLKLLRGMLGRLTPENALGEILSMLEKADTNQDLLGRIKTWAASMQG